MADDTADLKVLRRTVWRTAISGRVERFSELLEKPETASRYFGETFVDRLGARIDRLQRFVTLLAIAYTVLMLSLLASQDANKSEFEIFGYGFKNVGQLKEILLLVAACISPVSATLSVYQRYLGELRAKALEKLVPDAAAREFYGHIHKDSFLDPLVRPAYSSNFATHGFTTFLVAVFGLFLLLLLFALMGASFILQLVVIYDVATNPASSKYVNLFVVSFALSSLALSWIIALLQLPLPQTDYSSLHRLQKLEREEPEKYKEVLRRLAMESQRKELLRSTVVSILLFACVYSVVAVFVYPSSLEATAALLANALLGAVLTAAVSHMIVSRLKRLMFSWFFRTYPSESDERLSVFSRLSRLAAILTALVPGVVAFQFASLTLARL